MLYGVTTMDARVASSTTMFLRSLPATLMTAFGLLSLLLAGIGLYGVISYSVAQRTREFGMRMAVGASGGDLLRLVLGSVMKLCWIGIALAIPSAALLAKAGSSLFFKIQPADFISFVAVPLIIIVIATLASLVPASRAASLDPMEALRYD